MGARILGWMIPFKRYVSISILVVFAVMLTYLFYKIYETNMQKEKIKKLEVKIEHLILTNTQNKKDLQRLNKDINKTVSKLAVLHKKRLDIKVRYAIQKQKNQHSKDGNISDVLRDTFKFLRTKTKTADSNKDRVQKADYPP